MACSTRPYLLATNQRASRKKPTRVRPVSTNRVMRMDGVARGMSEDALEVGEAVVAAEACLVAEEQQHRRVGQACVMIEKYTPLMRERKAKKPNTNASRPGTSTTSSNVATKLSLRAQCQGSSFQSRNTMKSGRSLR